MKIRMLYCAFFALALPMLSACSGHAVRGIPPFVQVNGLALDQQDLSLDLGVRNANSVLLDIVQIEFSLRLDETDLAIYKAPSKATVPANGRENLRFALSANTEINQLLDELENGDRKSLEYTLEGVLTVVEDGALEFKRKGHLYPVPGRPGQFR